MQPACSVAFRILAHVLGRMGLCSLALEPVSPRPCQFAEALQLVTCHACVILAKRSRIRKGPLRPFRTPEAPDCAQELTKSHLYAIKLGQVRRLLERADDPGSATPGTAAVSSVPNAMHARLPWRIIVASAHALHHPCLRLASETQRIRGYRERRSPGRCPIRMHACACWDKPPRLLCG